MIALEPLGDRAWAVRFISEREAGCWASAVRTAHLEGVVDVILAYATVAVFADPWVVDLNSLEEALRGMEPVTTTEAEGRLFAIPVLYDGLDLESVARLAMLSVADVIALHAGSVYRVQAMGFQPGFPYAGNLPEPLRGMSRRETPRPRVPRGSVAIVGDQTAIYPTESPGGWHLIGRTPCSIADPDTSRFPIRVGDQIRFFPIDEAEYRSRLGEQLA